MAEDAGGRAPDGPDRVLDAAQRLAQGRLVAFPTETVYGLGADAENPEAVARVYAIKQRPAGHPVIVHIAPDVDPGYWAASVPPQARQLMAAFWPGPLTLILPRSGHVPDCVTGGQDSVGLRCPSHPVAQNLLHAFARLKPHGCGGVAAPSANRFGRVSPTRAEHVRAEFPGLDDQALMVLDGGDSEVGIESTIVDLSRLDQGAGPVLLRPGGVDVGQLTEVLGVPPAGADAAAPRVSGSLRAHYAPRTPVVLLSLDGVRELAAHRQAAGRAVALVLGVAPTGGPAGLDWHVMPQDSEEYARRLYAVLRELDTAGYDRIYVQQPPSQPQWQGVNDRLGRAAAAFGADAGPATG